jgi:predicted RNA methylase
MNKKYQFYETPEWLANYMCSFIVNAGKALEPSAGNGALINAFHKVFDTNIDCFELMPENREVLLNMDKTNLIGYDFLISDITYVYNTIIASPPFSDGIDMVHIRKMYLALSKNGRLITTCSSKISDERTEFLEWLKGLNAHIEVLKPDTFTNSGSTNKGSYLIIVDK